MSRWGRCAPACTWCTARPSEVATSRRAAAPSLARGSERGIEIISKSIHHPFSAGGASFDLSSSYKVAGRGRIDADGKGRWVSPTIPQAAAGLTIFLEVAVFHADGSIRDSNFTQLKIVG
jgi:hypothetical protein